MLAFVALAAARLVVSSLMINHAACLSVMCPELPAAAAASTFPVLLGMALPQT